MPEYQKHKLLKSRPQVPCTIHRVEIPNAIINDGLEHIFPMMGCVRILKADSNDGLLISIWYLSSPEHTEANLSIQIIGTGREVPNGLSYIGTAMLGGRYREVYHVFVNPSKFPTDRPYISH